MSTGYTAAIEDDPNITAQQFAMLCIRNFGVAVDFRDEPMDYEIPEHIPVDRYHYEQYEEAKKLLGEFEAMSARELVEYGEAEREKMIERLDQQIQEYRDLSSRYERLLNRITKWYCPQEFKNIQKFMIDQIEMSLPYDPRELTNIPTAHEIIKGKKASLRYDVTHHQEEWQKEVKRNMERNNYLKRFREAIKDLA